MKRALSLVPASLLFVACGGSVPAVGPARASGQSALMDGTFAGANKCSPKNHDRPFVVEWDATDMSQFEAIATSNLVFVAYTGCELRVVDTCRNDSVPGQFGAYRTIDWTSGSVEKIDIQNEGELYAKLPLGVATLGARVSAGEKFLMEYFVAGTRTATRAAQYRGDLATVPGCKDVTHFVYGYNLGAFALGSKKNIQGEAGATVWGVGAGGSSKYASAAEKKGGLLSTCRSESAQEVTGCKTPIRLSLRAIDEGKNPSAEAALAPETPDAKNLAGQLKREKDAGKSAEGHLASAEEKAMAKDGAGCLAEYDAYDRLEPESTKHTTNPASKYSQPRAACLLMTGQCDAGRELYTKSYAKMGVAPATIDMLVSDNVAKMCRGKGMTPREELVRAAATLHDGAFTKTEPKACRDAYDAAQRLKSQVKWAADSDVNLMLLPETLGERAPACFARAGDCKAAFDVYKEQNARPGAGAADLRARFDGKFAACKGK